MATLGTAHLLLNRSPFDDALGVSTGAYNTSLSSKIMTAFRDQASHQAEYVIPQVSVIIAFFEAAAFLEEAIQSVFAQSYSAWELILVDDGSLDASTDIAKRWAENHPSRVVYLEHEAHHNHGVAASRNLGVRHSRGRFVALLDADDVWASHKLQDQVALLEAHPDAGMVYGNLVYWHSWTMDSNDAVGDYKPQLGVPLDTVVPSLKILTRTLQRKASVPCPSSVLARRDLVEQIGGFEESLPGVVEDQAFFAKMWIAAPSYVASQTWGKYRIHNNSACSVAARMGDLGAARLAYLRWLGAYLDERGVVRGDAVWRALRLEKWRSRFRQTAALGWFFRLPQSVRRCTHVALSRHMRQRIRRQLRPFGGVRFGSLRRVDPVSRHFGYDRGRPVDRYYIEAFLAHHAHDIRGRVLEIANDSYSRQFGSDRVTRRDILDRNRGNRRATIIDDLTTGEQLPSATFDCIILTQTLQFIFDVHSAVRTLYRILRPGGVLLATVPGISQTDGGDSPWFWSFTPDSIRRLFEPCFLPRTLTIGWHGNVLAACAFLQGLASEELSSIELKSRDAHYPVIVTLRATKPAA